MNVPKLLRTALFSVFTLVVAAGMVAVPAQAQEVVVDTDGNGDVLEIGAGLDQLNGEVGSDGAGTLVIEAGDYTVDENTINVPGSGNSNLEEVTVEVREDGGRSDVLVEGLTVGGNVTGSTILVTSTSGNARLEVEDNTGTDLTLTDGTVNVQSDGELRLRNGGTVEVANSGGFGSASDPLATPGDFSIDYNTNGENITASAETSDGDLGSGSVTINGNGEVSFSDNLIDANGLTLNDEADASFSGDLTSATALSVGSNNVLSVGGALTVEGGSGGNSLDVTGELSAGSTAIQGSNNNVIAGSGAILSLGDVTFGEIDGQFNLTSGPEEVTVGTVTVTVTEGASDQAIVEGGGVFSAEVIQLQTAISDGGAFGNDSDDGVDQTVTLDILANSDGPSGAPTEFTVGDVTLDSSTDGDGDILETSVDVTSNNNQSASGQEITIGATELGTVDASTGDITIDAGTEEILLTDAFNVSSGATLTAASDVRYDASAGNATNSGEVFVGSGNAFTVDATDDGDDDRTVLTNSEGDNSGISGDGTLAVETSETSGGSDITVTIDGSGHDFPNLTHSGSGALIVEVGDDATGTVNQPITIGGNLTADAVTTFRGSAAGSGDDQVSSFTATDVTAGSNVTFDGFENGASSEVELSLNSLTTTGGTVQLPDNTSNLDAEIASDLVSQSGAVEARATDITTGNVDVQSSGTIDISDQGAQANQLEVRGDFTRSEGASPGLITDFGDDPNPSTGDPNSELLFSGQDAGTFNPGAQFIVNGKVTVNKINSELTLTAPIRLNGTLDITDNQGNQFADDPQLTLQSNLIFGVQDGVQSGVSGGVNAQNGALDLNGTLVTEEGNRVIFRETPDTYRITGTGTLRNVTVRTNGDDVIVGGSSNAGNILFTGTLDLVNGGVDIEGPSSSNPSDLSPSGSEAEVRRDVSGTAANTQINLSSNGTFNGEENLYDLAYDGNTGGTFADTQNEITEFVRDFTVAATTELDLRSSVGVAGALGLRGKVSSSNGSEIQLIGDGVTHTVTGAATTDEGTVAISADNDATITGGGEDDGLSSEINQLVVEDTVSATVSGIRNITGPVTLLNNSSGSTGSLSLGLAEAVDADQVVSGDVSVNDNTLTLDSRVEVAVNPSNSDQDVVTTADGASVNFGSNDLIIGSDGDDFNAAENTSYSANGGALVFDAGSPGDREGLNAGTSSNPNTVPNVEVNTPIDLEVDAAVSGRLAVNAGDVDNQGVSLNSNTLTATGEVVLNAAQSNNSQTPQAIGDENNETGVLEVSGATITVNRNASSTNVAGADQGISRLTVSGDAQVSLEPGTENTSRILYVPGSLVLATEQGGSLDLGNVNLSLTGSGSVQGTPSGFIVQDVENAGGNVTSSGGGELRFVGTGRGTVNPTFGRDVSVDRIATAELGGNNPALNLGDPQNGSRLTVEENLALEAKLENAGSNELAIADEATIERRADYTDGNVLTATPTFEGSVNLTYTEESVVGASSGPQFTSGREVPSEGSSASITDVGVDVGSSGSVDFQAVDTNNGIATGNVVVTSAFDLESGTVEHGVEGQSGSRRLEIADGGVFAQKNGSLETANSGNDQRIVASDYTLRYYPNGGSITTSDQEFLTGGAVSTLEFIDGPVSSPSDDNLELHADREVGALTVNRSGASTLDLTSGPSDDTERTLTVTGGSDLTAGTVNNGTLQAEGDVAVDGGDIGGSATLSFAGSGDQSLSLSGDETLGTVALNQTTPDGEAVPSATVSGGGLEGNATFNNGLLVIEGDNALDLGTNGFSRSTADEDTSHVIGSVTQRVNSGNTVVEYPVGSSNASYRPFGFIFPEAPTQDTDITVTHVDENPGEVGGLPFNDNTGVRIGQDYPDYYWTTESSKRLSISGTYEAFAQAEDLRFPDESADDFRIIRRPDSGDSWSLVGDGTGYSNTPISESEGRVDVSTTAATSDIRQSAGLFTIGQPAGDAPQIATNEGLTLTEGESAPITSAELEATDGDNAAGELTFEVTSGPSQGEIQVDGSQSSTFTQADVNNELVSYNHTASSSDNDSFELEVSDPNGNSVSATFDVTVEVGQVAISGSVNYPTVSDGNVVDGRALEGVEVEATSGDVTATATTDADGNFTIDGLDSGDYEVTANVDRDVSNVSIGDAQRTVSGFAGTEPFAGAFQEEVANVNARSGTNATDALRIAFFDLGSISSFEAGSFLVDTTEVTLDSESESGVSIRVAEFGDADLSGGSSDSGGDASLATTTVSPKSSAQTAAQTAAKSATESAGDANRVAAGETFEVPVRVDRGAEVGSYSLSLEYDTEKATFEGISSGRDDIITNGSKEDGTLQVGWFDRSGESTLELTGGSELVTLRFSAAEGVEGAEFAPEITGGEINGPDAKAVAAGVETQAVRIAKPAPDEFALNGSYPNPASQQATVEMDLPVRAQVTVEVYNTLGQRVQTVEQSMSAGAGQTVQLDASQLASGQYFYRVKASLDGNQTRETGRLTIVK